MSISAERARLHLERGVPELQELRRKKLFTPTEITAVVRKRSDFEHALAGKQTSSPATYSAYATYELNLDALRRLRAQKKGGLKLLHRGQKRVFEILDRGNRKFPEDVGLWMQNLEYSREQKSWKRVEVLVTKMLRLHPTKGELWVYAGRLAFEEEADMTKARAYMQRGLRFCQGNRELWVEFVRIEVGYVAKLEGRRKVLGIEGGSEDPVGIEVEANQEPTGEPLAVAKVLIDAGIKQFNDDEGDRFIEDLYDTCSKYSTFSLTQDLLHYITDEGLIAFPARARVQLVACKQLFFNVNTHTVEMVGAMRKLLKQLDAAETALPPSEKLLFAERLYEFLASLNQDETIDSDIRKVLAMQQERMQRLLSTSISPPLLPP